MAIHSSILAWRIPGTGEPGGLPSMGLHRVRHDWSDLAASVWTFFGIALLLIAMQTDLLQCCGHCWVFQICWHIECSTLTASYFRIESDILCLAAQLCLTLHDPTDCSPPGFFVHVDSPGKNIGVGCHALIIIYLTIFPLLGILVSFWFCMPINVEVNIRMHSLFHILDYFFWLDSETQD